MHNAERFYANEYELHITVNIKMVKDSQNYYRK